MGDHRSFQVSPEDVGSDVRILSLHGEADRFGTDAVTSAIQTARDEGRGVVIDVNPTSYLDSSMLAALVAASEQGRKGAQPIVILCETTRLRRSFELKGLQSILTLADSRDHALELVGAGQDGQGPGAA